jgi:hypothetical protein
LCTEEANILVGESVHTKKTKRLEGRSVIYPFGSTGVDFRYSELTTGRSVTQACFGDNQRTRYSVMISCSDNGLVPFGDPRSTLV